MTCHPKLAQPSVAFIVFPMCDTVVLPLVSDDEDIQPVSKQSRVRLNEMSGLNEMNRKNLFISMHKQLITNHCETSEFQ